jgi:phosphoesterase RecJ-like protein
MKTTTRSLLPIARALKTHHHFLVASHVRPDGDAIGSILAMGLVLQQLGKKVTLWNDDGVPRRFTFFSHHSLIKRSPSESDLSNSKFKIPPFDCVLALDTANFARLGRAGKITHALRASGSPPLLINLDHHESNEKYGDLHWISPHAAATCQMLYTLFQTQKLPITPEIAEALFVGIQTDTGSFRYSNANAQVFRDTAALVEQGVNVGEMGRLLYDTMTAGRLRLLKLVLNSLKFSRDGRIAYFWLTKQMYQQSGAEPEDTEDLINYARAVDSTVVAVLFEEISEKGKIRISLRSKTPKINASHITAKFGGGGHAGAAGATPEGKPAEIERRVLLEIRRALNQIGGRD